MELKNIFTTLLIIFTINCASANTITVDVNNGNNSDFSSIQEAINSAQENDAILIYKGSYPETLTIDKQLKIISASHNPEDVIIDSDTSSGPIIYITSDNVEIIGLKIRGSNSKNQTSGVYLDSVSNLLLQNNIISNVQDGILLSVSSENSIKNNTLLSNNLHGIHLINSMDNDLRNNIITDNKFGLYLNLSNQNILIDNNASNNENYGIALLDSNTNTLTNNKFYMNEYGLCLTDSHENIITDNIASNNRQSGFLLWISGSNNLKDNILIENENSGIYLLSSCYNNTFNGNILSNNVNGISIEDSSNNFVMNNTFSSNKEYGIFCLFSKNNNTIKENAFSNNKKGDDNLTSISRPIYIILILLIGTCLVYYLKKRSLLKKTL